MTGEELRRRREAMGLTTIQLGELLGVNRNTISRWERGEVAIQHPGMLTFALEALELRHVAHKLGHTIVHRHWPPFQDANPGPVGEAAEETPDSPN